MIGSAWHAHGYEDHGERGGLLRCRLPSRKSVLCPHGHMSTEQVTGVRRTLLESRLQERIPIEHPNLHCLPEFAAWQLTTRQIGPDGLTAHFRFTQTECIFRGYPLQLSVQRRQAKEDNPKSKCRYGYALGHSRTTCDYHVFRIKYTWYHRENQRPNRSETTETPWELLGINRNH